jgi:toxin FitB
VGPHEIGISRRAVSLISKSLGAGDPRPRQHNRKLVHWIGETPSQDRFVSLLTIGEIGRGIQRQRQLNPESERITSWLDMILRTYESRILAVDVGVARRWVVCPI